MKRLKLFEEFFVNESISHDIVLQILDAAAIFTGEAHVLADVEWRSTEDLIKTIKSDYIPKKHHSNFDTYVSRFLKSDTPDEVFEHELIKEAIEYKENGPLHWSKETKTFSGEVSDLKGIHGGEKSLSVTYMGKKIEFELYKTDKDASGEDTYGWRYKSVSGSKFPCFLLIVND